MPPVWFRLLVALSLWTSALAQGVPAPVISEFLASNSGGLRDEEGEVLGMLVLRPGKTKWERPKVPSIEDSKSVSVKSLGFEPDP
jgi:hypothetical protein